MSAKQDKAKGAYKWTTPRGDVVEIDQETINAVAAVGKVFPGSRAVWYWVPKKGWERP